MSKVRLTGSNSGYVEIAAAADAGNLTFTMPTTGTGLFGNGNNVISGITTFSAALDINSSIDVSGTSVFNNDVTFDGATAGYDVVWDRSDNALEFAANTKATFGNSQDMQLYHDGNHGYIADAGAGNLRLRSGTLEIQNLAGSKTSAVFSSGGGQTLNFNDSPKFVTTNTGAVVTGICTATSFSGSGENLTRTTQLSHRNKIINGAMQVAQRGTSVSVGSDSYTYLIDRFKLGRFNAGDWIMSKSSESPDGFSSSLKIDATSVTTGMGANREVGIYYVFEGQDLQDFAKGTSSAKEFTVSFYIKCNKNGTYHVELMDNDNSNRHVNKTYTVSNNNWTRHTITFPADTIGAFNNDNGNSMHLYFWLAAGGQFITGSRQETWGTLNQGSRAPGQANLMDSASNEWHITGVQLEVGSVATPFEHRSYGEELERCRRYYQVILDRSTDTGDDSGLGGTVYTGSGGAVYVPIRFCPPMRSFPTVESSNAGNEFRTRHGDLVNFDNFTGFNTVSRHGGTIMTAGAGNKTVGHYYWIETDQGSAKLAVSAEL